MSVRFVEVDYLFGSEVEVLLMLLQRKDQPLEIFVRVRNRKKLLKFLSAQNIRICLKRR